MKEMLDAGIIKASGYAEGGWVTGLKYEDEIREDLKARTSGKADELRVVCPPPFSGLQISTQFLDREARMSLAAGHEWTMLCSEYSLGRVCLHPYSCAWDCLSPWEPLAVKAGIPGGGKAISDGTLCSERSR